MRCDRIHTILACLAILAATASAEMLIPRTSMAQSAESMNLEAIIPTSFGRWKYVPGMRIVEPPGSDILSHEIYNQELSRGYSDEQGHVVMFLVAYGASQSDRLQLHRPEICYAAQGFRVSRPVESQLSYKAKTPPINVIRLLTQREERIEPVTYWMRIGNDVATGALQRQILKVTYGLHGLVPDGALVRISTVGLPRDVAFAVQDRFIRDLFKSLTVSAQRFLVGDLDKALSPNIKLSFSSAEDNN